MRMKKRGAKVGDLVGPLDTVAFGVDGSFPKARGALDWLELRPQDVVVGIGAVRYIGSFEVSSIGAIEKWWETNRHTNPLPDRRDGGF